MLTGRQVQTLALDDTSRSLWAHEGIGVEEVDEDRVELCEHVFHSDLEMALAKRSQRPS